MTDNMFDVETIALTLVACVLGQSGILLMDFTAAKINGTSKRLVERLDDIKNISLLGIGDPYPHLMRQPSKRKPLRCNATLLVLTVLYLLTSYVLDLRAALASTRLGPVFTALLPGLERLPARTHWPTALRRFVQLVNTMLSPYQT